MVPEENPYACLGLLPGSPPAEVKRRYRQLAKQYHPDANHEPAAEDTLRTLNAAYALLSDPARKAAYDTAFAARTAVFNPARMPAAVPLPRRRGPSARAVLSLALLLLLSVGVGFFFRTQNVSLLMSGLYSEWAGRAGGSDRPPSPYTFVPSHGAFDNASGASTDNASGSAGDSASAPDIPNQAGLP